MGSSSSVIDYLSSAGDFPEPQAAYIHVPFCHHHCGYCNFTLIAGRNDLVDAYLDALASELNRLQVQRKVKTIFIGGGTPSLLSAAQTERLLDMLATWFYLPSVIEFSIEVNPADVIEHKIKQWQSYGINRVSVGGQSFNARKLKCLERDHSPQQLQDSLFLLLQNFKRVSLDLIFGAPQETLEEWEIDLKQALSSEVGHLSTYGLTYEKGARFWGLRERGAIVPIEEEVELSMYKMAHHLLPSFGFKHYEVSNFAKPDQECAHNDTYWNGGRYWAFGPGAAFFVGRTRGVNHRSTTTYIKRLMQGYGVCAESEDLTDEQLQRERFVFGMRKLSGVNLRQLGLLEPGQAEANMLHKIEEHIAAGWMKRDGDRVYLTESGLWISDSLWPAYL